MKINARIAAALPMNANSEDIGIAAGQVIKEIFSKTEFTKITLSLEVYTKAEGIQPVLLADLQEVE